jgi:hypothetical protein
MRGRDDRQTPGRFKTRIAHFDSRRERPKWLSADNGSGSTRGNRKFTPRETKVLFFYSIGLPVLVTLATVAFTTAIQYISWLNSIRLQAAAEQASRAASVYDKIATNIGDRYYSIFLFIPSLMDIVDRTGTEETYITKYTSTIDIQRMSSYYEQIKRWDESYDQMLASADFNLDRPILLPIGEIKERNSITTDLGKSDCNQSMIGQMDHLGLSKHSLKAQFAILNHCFGAVTEKLDLYNSKAIADKNFKIDAKMKEDMEHAQANLNAMNNVFRCNAIRRVAFFNSEKAFAIVSPLTLVRHFADSKKKRITDHLSKVDAQCNS